MEFELKTERLTLRPVKSDDFEVFYQILTNEHVRRYLCDNEILPPEIIESFITDSEKSFAGENYGLWLIILNETGEAAGFTGLRNFFDEEQPQLLYALLPEFTGKGFATEAARKIIDYIFTQLNFKYLDASCDAPNIDSQKVAAKLGMKKIKEETKDGLPTIFFRLKNKND